MSEPTPRSWRDHQLAQQILVRFREFYREPEAIFWTFLFPILLAGGLGLAFRSKPADVAHVAFVQRREAVPMDIVTILAKAPQVQVRAMPEDSALAALRDGKVALVAINAGAGNLVYRFDPARDESRAARLMFDEALQSALGRVSPLRASDETISEKGSRYIDFVIPGLLGMNLMGGGIWGLGFALVDLRRKKLLKRLVATPMSRPMFLGSFMLTRLFMVCIEVTVLVGFGVLVFGVPVRGSLLTLATIALFGSLCFSGLGLLISSRVKTMEGASGLMNAVMLPMWVLSGVFFSSANFPAVMQPLVKALPLTAVNDALRLVMLQGAALSGVLPQLAVIGAWGLLCYGLSVRLFTWK